MGLSGEGRGPGNPALTKREIGNAGDELRRGLDDLRETAGRVLDFSRSVSRALGTPFPPMLDTPGKDAPPVPGGLLPSAINDVGIVRRALSEAIDLLSNIQRELGEP